MGINTPSEKLPVAKKSPSEIASDKQKGLLSDVEKESTIAEKKYKNPGEKALTQEQREKMTPEERKKYPLLEKGKKYISVGAVDKVPFKPTLRDKRWYVEMAATGKNLIQNFDAVSFDFPGLDKASLRKAVENIASVSTLDLITGTVTPEDYKKKIESGFSTDEIYGAHGAFNVILAFGRAQDLLNNVQPGASIDYRLKLAVNRYSKLLAKKEKAEKAEKVGGKSGISRQEIAEKAKKANKEAGEMFNEVMDDYFKQSRKLIERIGVCVANGSMSEEEARTYRESLNDLKYKDAESRANASDADFARLTLVVEVVDRVTAAVVKAEKPAEKKDAAVPREGYDARESRELAMRILSTSPMKARYELAEGQTLEQLAGVIALEAVKSVDPIAGKPVLDNLVILVKPIILAVLNNINKENIAKNAPSKVFVMDEDAQQRVITLILTELKKYSIKSNTEMRIKA